ncbi:MAG: sulfotransferase domain-containing protein [Halioglobus sp.]
MTTILPKFYIVGAPKCGTTTIYDWLGAHPSVCAPHKEPCFFSQDIFPTSHLSTHIPSLEAYCEIFSLKSGQLISGEATPKYLYSDQALSEIARLRPDARIIVCLRDPVELVISLHNQKLREGVEPEVNFEKAWARSLDSLASEDLGLPFDRHYYHWACIGSRLQAVYRHFPASSVLVLLTSELRADPQGCYLKMMEFLGLEDDGRQNFARHNERVRIRNLGFHRALLAVKQFLQPVLNPISQLRGGRGLGIMRLVNAVNLQSGQYTVSVSADFRAHMYQQLAEEIELVEKSLDCRRVMQ